MSQDNDKVSINDHLPQELPAIESGARDDAIESVAGDDVFHLSPTASPPQDIADLRRSECVRRPVDRLNL